jgi:hypothetical protein
MVPVNILVVEHDATLLATIDRLLATRGHR